MSLVFLRRHAVGAALSFAALACASLPAGSAFAASSADLSIRITAPATIASTTKSVRYTVKITNAGPSSVKSPWFDATFPPASKVLSVSPLKNVQCPITGASVRCTLTDTLLSRSSRTFYVDVDVTSTIASICSSPSTTTPQKAIAQIFYDLSKYIDPNVANNKSSTQFVMNCPPRVAGNLYVTESQPTYPVHQLLGGVLGDAVLGLDISAKDQDVNVTTLRFAVTSSANAIRAIDRLELYLNGATTPFAVATIAACGSTSVPQGTFCAVLTSQPLSILKDQKVSIVVRPRVKTDTDGTVTNTPITIGLQQWATMPVDAVTKASGVRLVKNDGDAIAEGEIFIGTAVPAPDQPVIGEKNVSVLSKVVSIDNANPDADGTAVPTGSARALGQFKLTAASASNTLNGLNRFTLDRAIFTVDLANVALDTSAFKFYNKADASVKSPCTVDPASTATKLFVDCSAIFASGVASEVEQGSSSTFVLESTITNPQVSSSVASSIQVSFEQYADASKTTVSPSESHVRWLDRDSASAVPFTWIESATNVVRSTKYGSSAQSRLLGDVNNDKALNSPDSTLIRRHLGGIITLTGADFTAADVDLDGKITYADLYLLRGAIVQMITLPARYGDVTGDGVLSSVDTDLIQEFVSGVKVPTNRQKYLGDVNVDGKIDQKDVHWVSQAVLKLVFLPVLCGNTIVNVDVNEQCDDGNQTSGDGCDNMCKIEVATQNELTIVQKTLVSTDTAVKNQKDITLLRFEATADNEDLSITSLAFDAKQGSLLNGANYTLKVDTNNDGVVDATLQSGVSPVSGIVTFNNIIGGGYTISSTKTLVFEVRSDVASSFVGNSLQLKFATSVPAYVSAERISGSNSLTGIKTDGVCATTCETTVATATSTLWTLQSQGNLFITQSTTPVRSHQLLGSTLSDDVFRLDFRADTENIDVTRLVFTAGGVDATAFSQNVSRLELYQVGATTPFAVATLASCGVDPVPANSMCASMQNRQLIVAKGTNVAVLVRILANSDANGAVSGKKFRLTLDASKGAQASGVSSASSLVENDGDAVAEGELFVGVSSPSASQTIVGKDHTVALSKVVSIISVDPNSNGSAIPAGSNRAISQLKFSTANHSNFNNGMNRVAIDSVIYTVNATNVALDPSAFKIYNKVDPTMTQSCTLDSASTATVKYVVCSGLITSGVNSIIDPASDITLVLQANVVSTQVAPSSSSSLQVSLQNFSDSTASALSVPGSHMRWIDQDNGASTVFLWMESAETVINGTAYQN